MKRRTTFNVRPLIRARQLKRWSPERLAVECELSASMIYKIESGERTPEKSIFRISKKLGVPMKDVIVDGSDAA